MLIPHPFQTFSLALLEITTFAIFIDRWAHRPPNTISQYLYEDSVYRRLFTLYTLLHIAVLYLSITRPYQHCALIVATVGWIWLVVCTNHGSRPLHITGAVVYMVGVFAFACMHSLEYESPSLRLLIQVLTTLSIGLACVFAYFESHRSHVTYIVEHTLFVMCQLINMSCLDFIFDDKRVAIVCLMIWLGIVLCAFAGIDLFHADFMHFGPSKNTKLMTMTIDTWNEWCLVAIASFASTCVNDFTGDSIVPWIQNTIQDHKTRYLPYSKATCFTIVQLWAIYCNIMSIFSVSLLMSQIDFLLIRLVADLIVNTFTTFKFLRAKEVNRRLYELEGRATFLQSHGPHANMQPDMAAVNHMMSDVMDSPLEGEDVSYPLKGRESSKK